MAQTEHRHDQPDAPEDVHAVGYFRPSVNDDGRAIPVAEHQQEISHLGREAARRAVVAGVAMGVVVAVAVGGIVALVAQPGATIVIAVGIAAGAFAAALGGLWGSFSRFGTTEDWREAVTQHDPPPRVTNDATGRPVAEPAEAEPLEQRGASEIHVVEPETARADETRSHETRSHAGNRQR